LKSGRHDDAFYRQLYETILSGQTFAGVFTNRKKDGQLYFEEETITPLRDGRGTITHFVSVGRDITARRRAEEELETSREQLQDLAAHLQSVREDERSRIAREIHDELGQALTGLKMDISWLASKLPQAQKALREKTRTMSSLVDSTVQSVRRIATDLRPGILDDLGLAAAIEWLAHDFHARAGIACHITATLENLDLEQNVSTAVFRVCQETLTNVARHADATRVTISLRQEGESLTLTVADNGKGISEPEIAGRRSLGLLGMRERARLLGGLLTVAGLPGEGTTVTMTVPLKQSERGPWETLA
jgi:signal transduction histidine kinase